MKFDDRLEIQRAMVIYAHPDDAEFGMAGTVARWARAGVEVTYLMATNGASGSQDPEMTRARLAAIRRGEQEEAARILGVARVVHLGFEDGYLEPNLELRRAVAREIRRHRPDAILTMDPTIRLPGNRYVNHPDHIAIGEAVLRSINPDASTRQMFPELWTEERLEPHKPKALFLQAFVEGADTTIDITRTIDVKLEALRAHRSQFDDVARFERFARELSARIGKPAGYRYAEAFKLIRLGEPPAEPLAKRPPARRSRRTRAARRPSRRAPRRSV